MRVIVKCGLAIAGGYWLFATSALAQDVTYTEHVAPILNANCANCHRPGEVAPISLLTYADARQHMSLSSLLVSDRLMPPCPASSRVWAKPDLHAPIKGAGIYRNSDSRPDSTVGCAASQLRRRQLPLMINFHPVRRDALITDILIGTTGIGGTWLGSEDGCRLSGHRDAAAGRGLPHVRYRWVVLPGHTGPSLRPGRPQVHRRPPRTGRGADG